MSTYPMDNLSPEERLKLLISYNINVEIDPNVSAKLYYRSGLNMFKQFNIYYKESSWENALCVHLKYEILFFDKIKKHPGYNKIPVNVKSVNAANFRLMKTKAEHARRELFKQYKREYMSYCDEMRRTRGSELIEGMRVTENSKGAQTKPRVGSHDVTKNRKTSSSENSKIFIGDSEVFRSKVTSLRSNNLYVSDHKVNDSFQEPKIPKSGSEVFRPKATNLKTTDRIGGNFPEPKLGKATSEIRSYRSKTTTLGTDEPKNTSTRVSGTSQGRKSSKGGSEEFRSRTTNIRAIQSSLGSDCQGSKSNKGGSKVLRSKTTSLKAIQYNSNQRISDNAHRSQQMDFNKVVQKLEVIQKGTQTLGSSLKVHERLKSKDQASQGNLVSMSGVNVKSALRVGDEKGNFKQQRFSFKS